MRKTVYFPHRMEIRLAPLQEATIEYMIKKYGGVKYRDATDYVRQAITHEARNVLSSDEWEHLCSWVNTKNPAEIERKER